MMKKNVIIGISIGIILIAGSSIFRNKNLIPRLDAISSNPNPLIRHFAPTWRSLKKIIDIPFFAVGMVSRDNLPSYEINLSGNDRFNLLNNLPDYPHENRLYESFKTPVKAEFRYGDYVTAKARIRYRGVSPNHWNALKKSFQVNLPDDQPLDGYTTYRFFIGEDKGWVKALLWNHLGDKLGILTPKAQAVRLVVNKKDMGVYIVIEGWEETFLERNKRPFGRILSNANMAVQNVDFLHADSLSQWYDRNEMDRGGETIPELVYLLALVTYAPDEIFEKEIDTILDIDQFLRWTLATILSGNFHQGNKANLNFYVNPATGKFEPIFFDASPTEIGETVDLAEHRVVNRMLASERFRTQFESLARSYVSDESNLTDDLAFYDRAARNILPAIWRDTAKLPTSWEAWRALRRDRAFYKQNFLKLRSMFETNNELTLAFADETYPLSSPVPDTSLQSFRAVSASRGEFLSRFPQFAAGAEPSTVILLPGTRIFNHDVIIPRGLRVVIREGARLLFAPGVSFISYSPVSAQGTFSQPIIATSLDSETPWGVFALINTGAENIFRHAYFSNGKDASINGLYLSGMLSAQNSDLDFQFGAIERAGADDGIHVLAGRALIENSLFADNFADSIDIDFAKADSLIAKNKFVLSAARDANGDAIDISFSALPIKNNDIKNCSDKGISVGEASMPRIENNSINGCAHGIAVKDRSEAVIANNIFKYNEIAIGLYRKKPHFISGGTAMIIENKFINNREDIFVDAYSKIIK